MSEAAPDDNFDVGVIVARFQVHRLHEGHREIIDYALARHDRVLIVLGASEVRATTRNPLDIPARRFMVKESYPQVEVAYIDDVGNNAAWSAKLDQIIASKTRHESAILYGSRDSFIRHYEGDLPTRTLEATKIVSGTTIRNEVSQAGAKASEDWRAGAIWSAMYRYPTAFSAVDLAIVSADSVLLVRKQNETLWRFPGGFVDPEWDDCDEAAAVREGREETGLTVWQNDLTYVLSRKQDDPRYRYEVDKIFTRLFMTHSFQGAVEPQDPEIAEARWMPWRGDLEGLLVETHHPFIQPLLSKIGD